jgi:hypothetical protein
MSDITNTITGSIKVIGLLEEGCSLSAQEFLLSLQELLAVEIPVQRITNVIISNQQPGDEDRNSLWVQQSNSGTVIGVRVFAAGAWVQLFPAPDQIFWLKGDSRVPPAGYRTVTAGTGIFTVDQYNELIRNAIPDPTNTYYVYYPAVFVGV